MILKQEKTNQLVARKPLRKKEGNCKKRNKPKDVSILQAVKLNPITQIILN